MILSIGDNYRIAVGGATCGSQSSTKVLIMKVLIVFAHPEPRSLNGSLRDVAVSEVGSDEPYREPPARK